MAQPDYDAPGLNKNGFNCPHCGIWAHQRWGNVMSLIPTVGTVTSPSLLLSWCQRCDKESVWRGGTLVHPVAGTAPLPSPDLPEEVKKDYEEARDIVPMSE